MNAILVEFDEDTKFYGLMYCENMINNISR